MTSASLQGAAAIAWLGGSLCFAEFMIGSGVAVCWLTLAIVCRIGETIEAKL